MAAYSDTTKLNLTQFSLHSQIEREVCCILFFFYIKPQHHFMQHVGDQGCILFFFYIKPQPGRQI